MITNRMNEFAEQANLTQAHQAAFLSWCDSSDTRATEIAGLDEARALYDEFMRWCTRYGLNVDKYEPAVIAVMIQIARRKGNL